MKQVKVEQEPWFGDELLERFGLVLTDDPEFDHDEQSFGQARDAFIAAVVNATPSPVVGDDLVELVKRAMYDAWPQTAFSPMLAHHYGVEVGTVLSYDQVLAGGGRMVAIDKYAPAVIAALTVPGGGVDPD